VDDGGLATLSPRSHPVTEFAQFVPLVLMLLMMALWQNAEWRVRRGLDRERRLHAMVEKLLAGEPEEPRS